MCKKIVHVIISLNVGGAELMLRRLVLTSSKKEQFEHCVISLTDLGVIGPKLQEQGIKVYNLNIASIQSLPLAFMKLRKLIKSINPDVVQTWMYHADLLGGLAAKSLGVKNIIWGIRNTDIRPDHNIAKKTFHKTCSYLSHSIPDKIVCVAKQAKIFHAQFGYDESKLLVIPNGFDIVKFAPNENQRSLLRSRLGIDQNDIVIGNIGRYLPIKNQVNFIKACISLMSEGYTFKVLLAGREVDLKNPEISILFKDKKLLQHFIFLGEIEDTSSFYNAIDVFCLCSSTEGFPNVLGEAMACENICLSTDAGDAWEILSDNGFKIKSTSPQDIAKAIEENLFNDSTSIKELQVLGHRARISIINNYSIDKVVSQFESLY